MEVEQNRLTAKHEQRKLYGLASVFSWSLSQHLFVKSQQWKHYDIIMCEICLKLFNGESRRASLTVDQFHKLLSCFHC